MSARSFPRLFLLSLLNLLLLSGCAVKGSVRLDPREPEQLIFESEVLVSEDLDPPAAPKPEAPAAPAEQEQKHPEEVELRQGEGHEKVRIQTYILGDYFSMPIFRCKITKHRGKEHGG